MGLFTPLAQVWYPTDTDTAELNTLLATLASSIENGLQPRLALQEKFVSAVLNVATTGTINLPQDTAVTIPFIVSSFGYNTGGMTLSGSGVLTVAQKGLYAINCNLTMNDVTNIYYLHQIMVSGVEKVRGYSYKPQNSVLQTSAQSTVLQLNAGDTVYAVATALNVGGGTLRNVSTAGNIISCTLLKGLT